LAGVRHLAHVRLVHHAHVRRLGEDHLGQLEIALALAGRVEERRVQVVDLFLLCLLSGGRLSRFGLSHQTFLPVGLPAGPLTLTGLVDWRTSTRAPLAPGTPPLISNRLRSASTLTTL